MAFVVAAGSPALADQARRNEWWLATLHVTNAWQTTRGAGVTIAVLDTGVNPEQADLTGSVLTGPDFTNSGRTPGGPFWGIHGTEVASLAAGHGHGPARADGIVGIAPAARILSVRVTLESGDPLLNNPAIASGLPNAIAHGIRWAVRHGATVIDLPLDPVTTAGAPGSGGSPAERAAVAFALAKHVTLVAPAGDGPAGSDAPNYPAAYRGVIAVGAFDRQFNKAPFSSRQRYVTVTAAGAGVTAAGPSGSYPQLNSTSAASAVVTGVVALIRAQFPSLTPAQVTKALARSTVYRPSGGRADGSGFGTVDAAKALTAAAGIAETVSRPAASGASAGQTPPSPPAVHSNPIHRNIRPILIKDAVLAGLVFVLMLVLLFAVKAWRRRHARSARLDAVRAAAQPPVRKGRPAAGSSAAGKGAAGKGAAKKGPGKKGPGKGTGKKGTGKKGGAKKGARPGTGVSVGVEMAAGLGGAAADEPQLQPAGFIPAPVGPAVPPPRPGGFTGSAAPPGFTGSAASPGFSGPVTSPGFSGPVTSPGFTGSAAGFTGSGFTGSASAFTGSASAFTGSGFTGSASSGFAAAPPAPGPGGTAAPGGTPGLGGAAGPGGTAAPAGTPAPAGTAGLGGAAGVAAARPGAAEGTGAPSGGAVPNTPAKPAQPAGPAAPSAAGTGAAPWAPAQPVARTQDVPAGAIPESAFPGAAFVSAPPAAPGDEGATGPGSVPGATGGGGLGRMGSRKTQGPRQPRATPVSGRPPWEPAAKPDSELPWVQAPAPSRGGTGSLPRREPVLPDLPSWDDVAQEVWPGGPKAAGPHPPAPRPGGPIGRPGFEGRLTTGTTPGGRVGPAAGLVPPRPDSPAQAATRDYSASQRAVPPVRRPSLALPRRLGGVMAARRADGGSLFDAGSGGGQAGAGPADGAAGTGGAGFGASQPPFPPAPRPVSEPGSSDAGQPGEAPFPRAIRPPRDPEAAKATPPSAGATSAGATGASGALGTGATSAGPSAASQPGRAFPPAAKPDSAQPKSGIPPWEITDSFLAVAPAEPSGTLRGTEPAAPSAPAAPRGHGSTTAGAADSAKSFPAVGPVAEYSLFPPSDPGASTASLPTVRPRPDLEDAFRLFPPVRGTGKEPSGSDSQD